MAGECLDALERGGLRDDRLQRKPLVDHQRVFFELAVEALERSASLRHIIQAERRQRRHAVRHLVGARDCRAASPIDAGSPVAAMRSRQALRSARRPALTASGL